MRVRDARVAAERRVDRAARRRVALHEREVDAPHAAIGELLRRARPAPRPSSRPPAGRSCPCRGDARCRRAARRRAPARAQQRVEQRAVRLAGAGMHDQAGRLVDDDQVGVLVHDLERHALRRRGDRVRRRAAARAPRCSPPVTGLRAAAALAVDRDVAGLQPGLQAVARVLREQARQRLVEAQPAELRAARWQRHRRGEAPPRPSRAIIFAVPCVRSLLAAALPRRRPARSPAAARFFGQRTRPSAGRRSAFTARRRTRWRGKDWAKAIKYLEKLEARYPYGRFAQQAQLEVAYATGRTASAPRRSPPPTASSSSIRTMPNVDYAWYLKGLINFNEHVGRPRQRDHARHDRPRSQGVARGVRRVQGSGDALPGVEVRRRIRRRACATSSTRSPRTRCTSRATT